MPRSPSALRVAGTLAVLALASCNGPGGGPLASPTGPDALPLPDPTLERVFDGEAVQVVDAVSALCDLPEIYPSVPADPQARVRADTIEFLSYSDWVGYEALRGTVTGGSFVATSPARDAPSACSLHQIWFSGVFSDDFGSFEAYETDVYGPPGDQLTTEWHWTFRSR